MVPCRIWAAVSTACWSALTSETLNSLLEVPATSKFGVQSMGIRSRLRCVERRRRDPDKKKRERCRMGGNGPNKTEESSFVRLRVRGVWVASGILRGWFRASFKNENRRGG